MSRRSKLVGIVLTTVLIPMMGQACPPNGEEMMPAPAPSQADPVGPVGPVGPAGPPGASPFALVGSDAVLNGKVFADAFSGHSPLLLQTAGTTRLFVDDLTGDVGIGTTTPLSLLHVDGDVRVGSDVRVDGSVGIGTTIAPTAALQVVGDENDGTDAALKVVSSFSTMLIDGDEIDTAGVFKTLSLNGNSTGDVLLANGGGNVGVGTVSPTAALHVVGAENDGTDAALKIQSGVSPFSNVMLLDGTQIDATGFLASLSLNNNSSGNVFLANGGGDVGIGTTNPAQKLHVVGNICATGMVTACSDKRFKMGVKTVENALSKVAKLQGVNFDWRRDEYPDHHFSDKRQVGFIAQDIMKVIPEAVSQGRDGYYSVDYGRLTPVLVEAVKELKDEHGGDIAALRIECARLRWKNEQLAARLARLEALLARGDEAAR